MRNTWLRYAIAAGLVALAVGLVAGSGLGAVKRSTSPTVSLMVGGIDKQIYLPYQLAQGLGYYKKYGVNVQLSTESAGGVGAEDALAAGQVNMAGAWYVHTIDFQQHGKNVIDVVQLSGAPGEREMCAKSSGVTSPAQWVGKTVGVTDLGSGTDDLTLYLAARQHVSSKQFTRLGVGAGSTFISALQHGRIACGMTTQPTVNAIENQGIGYSAIDLASQKGVKRWLGGNLPTASVLVQKSWGDSHKASVQKVVDALVATMHYIHTHSAAQIAAHMPADFVSNQLTTRADYISALAKDKNQFLADGIMPSSGPRTVFNVEKLAGKITGNVTLHSTYTNAFAIKANQTEGYMKKNCKPATAKKCRTKKAY